MLKWPPEGRGWGIVFFGGLLNPDWLSYISGMTTVWFFHKVEKWFLKALSNFSNQRPSLHPCKTKWQVWSSCSPSQTPCQVLWLEWCPGFLVIPHSLGSQALLAISPQTGRGPNSGAHLCPTKGTQFGWIYYLSWWLYFQCFRTTNRNQTGMKEWNIVRK